jgi:hypothetical protein
VTGDRCEHWRGLLALEVVGQLSDADRPGLEAHLDGCPACRAERHDLAAVGAMLSSASPLRSAEPVVPPHLSDAVVTRLRADARIDRRRRRQRLSVLSGAAAAVVMAAGVLAGLQPWAGSPGRTMALAGTPGVHATETLFPESWGTRLHLVETGQPGGQALTVEMRSRGGHWWDAGTYRTVAGRQVRADFACAVPAGDVYQVNVRDDQGHVVLSAEV